MHDSSIVGTGTLSGGLYKIDIDFNFEKTINTIVGNKRKRIIGTSSMLWHRRLSHMSRDRIERLIKENVLPELDFSDFGACIDCIKGKLTTRAKKGKRTKRQELLELIHIDVCRPLSPNAMGGFKYFITFINDHSRFGWVELLTKKLKHWMHSRNLML